MAAVFLCAVSVSHGQKQQTDSKTLEVNFSPLGGNPISINGLKFRKFSSDYSALRFEVFLGYGSDKSVAMQEGANGETDNANPATFDTSGSFDLSLRPGIEKHFDGTNRLSPYVGGLLDVGFGSSSNSNGYWSPNSNDPAVTGTSGFGAHTEWEQKTKDGYFRFGLNAVAGMDFYFADNIYLGAEFGFGLSYTSFSDTKYSATDEIAWGLQGTSGFSDVNWGNGELLDASGEVISDPFSGTVVASVNARDNEANGSSFNIGPNVNGALRLGFIF